MTSLPASLHRPFVWTLPLSQRRLQFVDLAQLGEPGVSEAFQLITDSASRSDNIGIDEVPTENYYRWMLSHADDAVVLYDDVTADSNNASSGKGDGAPQMTGLIIVFPCRYVRSCSPPSCSLTIITAQSSSTVAVWRDLTRIGFEISRTGNNRSRYAGCMIDVFVTCFDRVMALRSEGYVVTACIPVAGRVARFPNRHVDSYIMYREFEDAEAPPLQLLSNDNDEDTDVPLNVELRMIPYLPVTYVRKDGTPMLVRNFNGSEDIRLFYKALKAAAESDSGYGADELPSLAYFAEWYISGFYNYVIELLPVDRKPNSTNIKGDEEKIPASDKATVIAYANIGPSLFSRSIDRPQLSDGNVIILPRFRGRGLATEIQDINMGIGYDLGMASTFGETSVSNLAGLSAMQNNGVTLTGSIPRGIYFRQTGWTDLVTMYLKLNKERSFLTKVQQQQENRKLNLAKL